MSKPKIMVALRDTDHADDLTKLACQMSNTLGADLVALHVVEVGPGLPLDADAEILDQPGKALLAHVREVASKDCSKQISTRLVRGREAGRSIVAEAEDSGAQLLILGYHQKHRAASEFLFGSTVQYVAHHTPCQVIIHVPPALAA